MIFKPGLYIVSTPIGNLEDITIRAIETLKSSTIILCENTRISSKLLTRYNIKVKLQIYNDLSSAKDRANIQALIDDGGIISLISDAGTPLISDPGFKLVHNLRKLNYHIDVIPGASSVVTALAISGLPSNRFFFAGFLPKTTLSKRTIFTELANIKATLIFFETANRLEQTLKIALSILENREICIARELTKLHQEVKTGLMQDIINFYQQNIIKGEIVLLISPITQETDKSNSKDNLNKMINLYLSKGWSAKSITDLANKNFAKLYSKKEIYSKVNKLKK